MRRLTSRKRKSAEEIEVDLVPIMNMFLVLIPFLLMAANFINLKAINTSVPVLSQAQNDTEKQKDTKMTVVVEIGQQDMIFSAISTNPETDVSRWDEKIKKKSDEAYPYDQMFAYLKRIKDLYPASDTLIIVPQKEVIYDTIIQAMDVARYDDANLPLFPNVVLSGKVG